MWVTAIHYTEYMMLFRGWGHFHFRPVFLHRPRTAINSAIRSVQLLEKPKILWGHVIVLLCWDILLLNDINKVSFVFERETVIATSMWTTFSTQVLRRKISVVFANQWSKSHLQFRNGVYLKHFKSDMSWTAYYISKPITPYESF